MSVRPIVVGVDGSEESLRAVEWAAREAERRRSPLRIVSALAMPPRTSPHDCPAMTANVLRGFAGRALGGAASRAEKIAPRLRVDADLLSGPPMLAVPEAGSGAAMLVVGARGTGGLGAAGLGSVCRHAVIDAPCPVVVVRDEPTAAGLPVVVGIRDPENASQALAFAFEEAALRHTELVAVHTCMPLAPLTGSGPDSSAVTGDPEEVCVQAASQLGQALDRWQQKYPGVRIRQDVISGYPVRVLCSYCARADLVVLGRHDNPGAAVRTIGCIHYDVLNHGRGPIAIIPSTTDARDVTDGWRRPWR